MTAADFAYIYDSLTAINDCRGLQALERIEDVVKQASKKQQPRQYYRDKFIQLQTLCPTEAATTLIALLREMVASYEPNQVIDMCNILRKQIVSLDDFDLVLAAITAPDDLQLVIKSRLLDDFIRNICLILRLPAANIGYYRASIQAIEMLWPTDWPAIVQGISPDVAEQVVNIMLGFKPNYSDEFKATMADEIVRFQANRWFALIVCGADGYLTAKPTAENAQRWLGICAGLPLDLQMLVAARLAGAPDTAVRSLTELSLHWALQMID